MTDEEYVFQQDVKERKKMKTGAMHRKSGAKSKKCTLPSDHLTPSQKKKLNGECEIMNLNKPLSGMDELRKYSVTLQVEYLKNCIENYGARKTDIIKMLKTTYNNFNHYCERNRITLKFPDSGTGWHSKMDERWAKFVGVPVKVPINPFVKKRAEPERKPEIIEMIPVSDNGTQLLDQKIIPSESKPAEESESTAVRFDVQPTTSIRDILQECADAIIGKESNDTAQKAMLATDDKPDIVRKELPLPWDTAKEPVSGYNAVRRMKIDLKGSKAEIMHLMEAILGQECSYVVKLDIINVDKKNSA